MTNLIEELKWRGLLQDIIPGTEEQLSKEMTTAYIGFDPTANSLHIGNLVPVILLMHLQKCGHKPIALVGGATGMVGDPSGKSAERNMLPLETIQQNINAQRKQLEQFLNFDPALPNCAEIVNNFDWFQHISFLDFIRDIGKYITVNYMMSKDSVQNRLESGMSFTEFSYQLVQGYDFYYLNQHKNVKMQMGGSDQWGNIVTGTELIRKKSGNDVFAFTAPLLKKSDGSKFGKSESGNVWIDRNKTSPYKFYQFWRKAVDEDAERYIKVFTFLSQSEIESLIATHREALHLCVLQKRLARELTIMVHSEKDYEFAVNASEILFSENTADTLRSLSEAELLDVMEGVPAFEIAEELLSEGMNLISLLADTQIFKSKGEARKMVQSGGVRLNKNKVMDVDYVVRTEDLLNHKYLLVQKGKTNYHLVMIK